MLIKETNEHGASTLLQISLRFKLSCLLARRFLAWLWEWMADIHAREKWMCC